VAHGIQRTFLVESYVQHLDDRSAATITARLRATVRQLEKEGNALCWLRSFALVGEETYLCFVAASDRDHVLELSRRTGLECDYVVEVVPIEPSAAASG
jgi:hypothetical protein